MTRRGMITRGDWLCAVGYPGKIDSVQYDTPGYTTPGRFIKIRITQRNRNQNRKYFNTLVSGPGWFKWWKKLEVENLVGLSLQMRELHVQYIIIQQFFLFKNFFWKLKKELDIFKFRTPYRNGYNAWKNIQENTFLWNTEMHRNCYCCRVGPRLFWAKIFLPKSLDIANTTHPWFLPGYYHPWYDCSFHLDDGDYLEPRRRTRSWPNCQNILILLLF